MKKRYLCVLSICMILLVLSVVFSLSKQKDNYILKIAIFHNANDDDSYLLTLDKDKNLVCMYGVRKDNTDSLDGFLKSVKQKKSIIISDDSLSSIIGYANSLAEEDYEYKKTVFVDGYSIILEYQGGIYETPYKYNSTDIIHEMLKDLIPLSPVPVKVPGYL